MSAAQLFFDFRKSLWSLLGPTPSRLGTPLQTPPTLPRPTRKHNRDLTLEKLGHRLLKEAGWKSPEVKVQWNPRLRTTAGLADWRTRTISLNPRLKDVSEDEVHRTLLHELAHFLAQSRAGRGRIAAHGPEWRQACGDLGIPQESRCHDLPFARSRRTPKHFYACPQCGTSLARVRPLRRPLACLSCCRRHNRGRYDARFRFVPAPIPRPHEVEGPQEPMNPLPADEKF